MPDEHDVSVTSGTHIGVVTEPDLPMLCDQVAELDSDLASIIETFGYPPYWSRPNTFESLVWFILEQQVSLASAKAALEKLRTHIGTITPENMMSLDDDEMRAAYFSRQKTAYVRALAKEIVDGRLDLSALENLADDGVRARLVQLKGIGNWTVDVYLILTLHRLDVFPTGDLAAVNALKRIKGLPRDTAVDELVPIARSWTPLRTVATTLLWHEYLSRKQAP